jgi:hypothetical protein
MSCATINHQLVDPQGRELPTPHYKVNPVGYPLYITFYYTANEHIYDVDSTLILKPKFLALGETYDIFAEKYKSITLTIEVNNPQGIEYSLYQQITATLKSPTARMDIGGTLNKSNMRYRQYVFQLPYAERVREVDHSITLKIDDVDVFMFGNFTYTLIH